MKGNKGEWSEVYAFFKLLADGKLYVADGNLNKKDNIFYNIIEIIRNEEISTLHFKINEKNKTINVVNENDDIRINLNIEMFKEQSEFLYNKITEKKGTASFEIIGTTEFMKEIKCSRLKAPSADKSDITIKVHDFTTGLNPVLGFSIKSKLGKPSTLLNAGVNTNFVFEMVGNMNDNIMDYINNMFTEKVTNGSIRKDISVSARMAQIKYSGLTLKYVNMNSATFQNNLTLIDSDLPQIVGYALLEYYLNGTNNILDALDIVTEKNPLNYDLSQGHKFYYYKFKKFLTESALGMLPGKVWSGKADATGGYIIVREDGEILCYHLYNRNDFEEYLLGNTRFDRGGAGRHEYSVVYKENGKYYIKLNLQIRFVK